MVPVVGVGASALILGERPSVADLAGFALILAAAACAPGQTPPRPLLVLVLVCHDGRIAAVLADLGALEPDPSRALVLDEFRDIIERVLRDRLAADRGQNFQV